MRNALVLALVLSGCSVVPPPPGQGGDPLGGGPFGTAPSPGAGSPVDLYTGRWQVVSGTSFENCAPWTVGDVSDGGFWTVAATGPASFSLTDQEGCSYTFTIDTAGTATIDPGQSCWLGFGTSTTFGDRISYPVWVMDTSDGVTLTSHRSISNAYNNPGGGGSGTCTWMPVTDDTATHY